MKQQTVTPPDTGDDTPEQKTFFTYENAGSSKNIVQSSESAYSDDALLSTRTYRYDTTSDSSEFGRVIAQTDVLYGHSEGLAYTSSLSFSTTITNGEMTQSTVFTGHDELTSTTARVQSAYSGNLLAQTDAQSVTTRYTYDLAGRILTQTASSGTDYENTQSWSYAVGDTGPVTTQTDASGNKVRTYYDGVGRIIRRHGMMWIPQHPGMTSRPRSIMPLVRISRPEVMTGN